MDPITSAIVAALPALAKDVVSSAVTDAYSGLKSLIIRKFGTTSPIAKSVDDLEADPESKGHAMVLSERVAKANATADAEIMQAVERLTEVLTRANLPGASNVNIEVTVTGGDVGVAGAQSVLIHSMNVGGPEPRDKG